MNRRRFDALLRERWHQCALAGTSLVKVAALGSLATPELAAAGTLLIVTSTYGAGEAPDSARAFEGMKSRGVLVKHIAGLHPLLACCLRLTVGTPQENDQMLVALKESL